jgi:cell division protein FtsI/penicillin-binding protein 2
MSKLAGVLAGLLVPAFLVAGVVATPAMAQEKTAKKMEKGKAGQLVIKEIAQNDKLRIYEAIFNPGDTSPSVKRPMRAVYTIKGGTLERTYEDGKKENIAWKTGESKLIGEERPYALKNVGKTVIRLHIVQLK